MRRFALAAALSLLPAIASAQSAPGWSKSPAGAPQHPAQPGQAAPAAGNVGKVLETSNAAGYTYLRLNSAGKEVWVAVPEMKVAVGDTVQWTSGAPMQNFFSKSMNRTFPLIQFSSGAQVTR